jgi:predicted ATP-grasp superfamily ATP-dependent carboligase
MAKALSKTCRIDAMILTSGLDDDFRVLNELSRLAPILGNSVEVIQNVRKKQFFAELTRLGIDCPKTFVAKNADDAEAAAAEIGYPVVVKSTKSFAGMSAELAESPEEIRDAYSGTRDLKEKFMVQEFIDGTHASISFLSTENDVQILTINEQLLGLKSLFSPKPFGYCGNIVPLDASNVVFRKCKQLTEEVALHFGLQGSNGIDVVISKEAKPYVIEVNPRFQGTLECVERVLGINVVQAHVDACLKGVLPRFERKTSTYCSRLILYAPKRAKCPDLAGLPEVRDVPIVESIIEKGEPLCSILAEGNSRDSSFEKAKALAESVYAMFHSA